MKLSNTISVFLLLLFCLIFNGVQTLCAQEALIEHDTVKARRYFEKGKVLAENLQIEEAINVFSLALPIFKEAEKWTNVVDAYNRLGYLLIENGRYDEARTVLKRNLIITSAHLSSDSLTGRTLQNLGYMYTEVGKYDSAEFFLKQAIDNRLKNYGPNSGEVDEIYYSLSRLYFFMDDFQAAEKYAQLVMSGTKEQARNHLRRAQAFNLLAIIFYVKADYTNAKIYFELGLKAFDDDRSLKDQNTYYSTIENLGAMEFLTGNYELAYQYYLQALNWRLQYYSENHASLSSSYFNIAEVMDRRKEYDEAIRLLEKCIELRINSYGQQHESTLEAMATLGMVYFNLGDYHKALSTLKDALVNTRITDKDYSGSVSLYEQLGDVYHSIGEYDSSRYYYDLSVDLLEKKYGNQHPRVAAGLVKKSKLFRDMGNLEMSILEGRKALNSIFQQTKDDPLSHKVFYSAESIEVLKSISVTLRLAYLEDIRGPEALEQALDQIHRAIDLIQKRRIMIFDNKAQHEFLERFAPVYEEGLRIIALLYQHTSDEHYLQVAFRMLEDSKAFNLTRSILDSAEPKELHLPDSLIEKEHSLKVDISYYDQKILEMKRSVARSDTLLLKGFEDQLFDLKRDFENLKFRLKREYPEYYELQYDFQTKSIENIQKHLTEHDLLIQFFWSDDVIFAFGISEDDVTFREIAIDNEFLNALTQLNTGFVSSKSILTPQKFAASSHTIFLELFKEMLVPYDSEVGRLIIMPDGMLSKLNFDLLVTDLPVGEIEWKDINYLIKDFSISIAYSASLFLKDKSSNSVPEKDLLAFSFGEQDQAEGNHLSMNLLRSSDLSEIPGSAMEVKTIADMVEGDYYYGEKASEQTFKEVAGDYQILHLALHGSVDDENPDYSKLHFHTNDTTEDGQLHVFELYNMELNADLAVLSACNTGTGKFQTGEGVMSLGHAFSYAGVNSLLLTRWDLSDEAAPEIMRVFYRELKAGKTKSEALRTAKLEYLENASIFHANPFYWSSFFVLGNDAPIEFSTSNRWMYAGMVGALFLLLAFVLKRRRLS